MHTGYLLGRQCRGFFLARELDQQIGNPVLLLGGQLSDFRNGFFETLGHFSIISFDGANFHPARQRHSSASCLPNIGVGDKYILIFF